MLVGLRVGEAAFQAVVDARRGSRERFVRNALRLMENNGYDGIRLWWHGAATCSQDDLIEAAKEISDSLGKRRYSFGFFLPYEPSPSSSYLTRLSRLRRALRGAPYSLLLYPTFPAFRNRTSWPSPADMAIQWKAARGDLTFCHVLPQQPVWVALGEKCDVSRSQRISRLVSPTAAALFEPCRLLGEDSWHRTTRRFHSYACRNGTGVLYQTAVQADAFRHEFLAETKMPCVGSIGEAISDVDCDESADDGAR
ncbi:hypothetical protein V5799_026379 [Amblyomma americanum]|uniref:Uncharacterized protein n=1 Tax=Amblyomma americanum TaxID=6943 RepID=A0AAQ4DIR6_AMBAM